MIPIKVALLLGVTWFWVAAIVVRLPRIATRKEGLLLRGGLIWGVKVIAWHHIDSVVVWHGSPSRGAGMRDMIGVKMKRGVPQSVKFPEKERKRGRITDPGFGTVPREVPLNSIALDALRPEDVVKLLRESHPRVHVLDLRDPLQVVDLSAEVDGPN
ncbi:hypothetical protein [Glycomyces sp. NPDC048151]|uniref:hypothetical protein n=1 Tax=Glycomyces sp. NPDC048151 TaxID=3364002 RepID=UPI003711A18D